MLANPASTRPRDIIVNQPNPAHGDHVMHGKLGRTTGRTIDLCEDDKVAHEVEVVLTDGRVFYLASDSLTECECDEDRYCTDECEDHAADGRHRDAQDAPRHFLRTDHPVYSDPAYWWEVNENPGAGR